MCSLLDVLCLCCAAVGGDVMVANTDFRPTSSSPLALVSFTLRVDGVSQEINETFYISLTLNPATAPPDYFYPMITVSIIDQDGEFS